MGIKCRHQPKMMVPGWIKDRKQITKQSEFYSSQTEASRSPLTLLSGVDPKTQLGVLDIHSCLDPCYRSCRYYPVGHSSGCSCPCHPSWEGSGPSAILYPCQAWAWASLERWRLRSAPPSGRRWPAWPRTRWGCQGYVKTVFLKLLWVMAPLKFSELSTANLPGG